MLYFELLCGASGDMILASLVDLGVPLSHLRASLRRLGIPGLRIGQTRQLRAGRSCLQLAITWSEARQRKYRNLAAILALLGRGKYPPTVLATCRRVLGRLAEAESRVHGVPVEQVHFHEIGAIDTVVDVLGFALALDYLGVNSVRFSTLTVGTGTVDTTHGRLSVPAPATRVMLSGFRVRTLDTGTEILTPTGCAILTACGRQVSDEQVESGHDAAGQVAGKAEDRRLGEGFGCGQKNISGFPDYLRVLHLSDESDTY